MAQDKKSFLLYCDLLPTVSKMPNDKAGELFKHILSYVNDENPETNDLIIQLVFEPIKQQLKRDLVKYQNVREKNSLNARKRWDATACEPMPVDSKHADTDNVNDTDTVKEENKIFSFDEFWELYPKKVAKEKCKSKFNKLSKNDLQKINDTIKDWVAFKPFATYNHPNPETYLNQKRWNDEIKKEPVKPNPLAPRPSSNPINPYDAFR